MQQLSNRYLVCESLRLAVNLQEFGCAKLAIFKAYTTRKIWFSNEITNSLAEIHDTFRIERLFTQLFP